MCVCVCVCVCVRGYSIDCMYTPCYLVVVLLVVVGIVKSRQI